MAGICSVASITIARREIFEIIRFKPDRKTPTSWGCPPAFSDGLECRHPLVSHAKVPFPTATPRHADSPSRGHYSASFSFSGNAQVGPSSDFRPDSRTKGQYEPLLKPYYLACMLGFVWLLPMLLGSTGAESKRLEEGFLSSENSARVR